MRPYKRCKLGTTVAPILVMGILALSSHTCLGGDESGVSPRKHPLRPQIHFSQDTEMTATPTTLPRILTVLTTYNKRTPFVKAYREAAVDRQDGYEPLIFITSDEEDEDQEGIIDFKYGEPQRHRLLAALGEATSRYEGQFDWIAVGDDDTVFLYRRVMSLLRHIDHTQPIAIGLVHGFCGDGQWRRAPCECFSPEDPMYTSLMENMYGEDTVYGSIVANMFYRLMREKYNASTTLSAEGCCLDFTQPCEVSVRPEIGMNDSSMAEFLSKGIRVYNGDFYWPYGGSGFLLSAGVAATVQASEPGWERCREMFGHTNTDIQVAQCLVAHGFTMSSFQKGFYRPVTAVAEEIQDYLASNCQVIGVHAGIRHLKDHSEYTPDKFKTTLSAVWAEDDAESWTVDDDLETGCPQIWDDLSMWK